MIKVTDITLNTTDKTAVVSLFADTKSEVTSSATIVGLPSGYEIGFGSSCLTANGEFAFYKSNKSWNWL